MDFTYSLRKQPTPPLLSLYFPHDLGSSFHKFLLKSTLDESVHQPFLDELEERELLNSSILTDDFPPEIITARMKGLGHLSFMFEHFILQLKVAYFIKV